MRNGVEVDADYHLFSYSNHCLQYSPSLFTSYTHHTLPYLLHNPIIHRTTMELNFRRSNSEMEHDPNQMYLTPYFNCTSFSDHSIQDGLRSGSMETIQRELEKKRIREEILAEEAARRRVLEEEVRRELMFEKYNGGGSFLVSQKTPIQPFSMAERYGGGGGGGGHHRREIREFEAVPRGVQKVNRSN